MHLVSFAGGFGRIEGDEIVPMGRDVLDYLGTGRFRDSPALPLGRTTLAAPVPRPGKILCIGLNYRDHAAEAGWALPEMPVVFAKFSNAVVGPGAAIRARLDVGDLDYEAELGVVIGRRARAVTAEAALDHVAGYTCVNDISSRRLQFATSQWFAGKCLDTFLPMGPWLTTADEIPDPQQLSISCSVNGEIRQDSTTAEMIFPVNELVSHLSRLMTLEPGDVIATGTPSGVGMALKPPAYLRDEDVVAVEISRIGRLTNAVRVTSG